MRRRRLPPLPATEPLEPERFTNFVRMVSDPARRVVLGLGGGSVSGLAGNVALLRLLEELGLRPHVAEVWGTSAGAVVGGGWASGTKALRILDLVRGLARPGSLDVCWGQLARSALLRPFGVPLPAGLVAGRRFRAAIERGLTVPTFEECEIPFRAIAACGDEELRRHVFRRGPLLPAIFASMTLPGIVVPEPIRGDDGPQEYVDGGVVEKTPLLSPLADHGRSGDPRELLLVCTHFGNDSWRAARGGFPVRFLRSIYALEDLVWRQQLDDVRSRRGVLPLVLNPHLTDTSLFDFARTGVDYADARKRFVERLADGNLPLAFGAE